MHTFGGLYLGCPQWHVRQWNESIFPSKINSRDALQHYAEVFNTVEGNTTFYAVPSSQTVERWASVLPDTFRLVLKFPQEVTHERLLDQKALEHALRFLEHMSPLGERLEYILIQLPAHFDQRYFNRLYRFLMALPKQDHQGKKRHYAVELRAPSLTIAQPEGQGLFEEVNQLLSATATERVWMDTRALRAALYPGDEATQTALKRKPNLAVYPIGLGPSPMVRYVANPDINFNSPWLKAWAQVFAKWLDEGRKPFFFAHYPGEVFAPQIADLFYSLLRKESPTLPARPLWPSERQTTLF